MPGTSRTSLPTPLAMSTVPSHPTSSPVPVNNESAGIEATSASSGENAKNAEAKSAVYKSATRPHPKPSFPSPKLWLRCQDLCHQGCQRFFRSTNPSCCLDDAVHTVLSALYEPSVSNAHIPPTRSVTLCLRPMDGIAYTCGTALDEDHKEVHISLDYLSGIQSESTDKIGHEIRGIIFHEMVHAWQWNGKGKAPSGLIEGIADFVRLKAGLRPPHWKREVPSNWDAGYQQTAYFLEWLENHKGPGSVRRINATLQGEEYKEDELWPSLFGRTVEDLFNDYKAYLDENSPNERSSNLSMKDIEFWNLVKQEKGEEQTIVMKAIWRTRRHLKKDHDERSDHIGKELDHFWSIYQDQSDTDNKDCATVSNNASNSDEESNGASGDDSPVMVAKDDGV